KEGDNYYYYRKSLSSNSGSSSSFSTGTGKRRFSRNLSCPKDAESKEEDNIVLRSPVPWRSRSGRMQLREEEKEEIQSKSLHEDVGVRKTMYPQSSPVPPPSPPPPPPPPHRLVLLNNNKIKVNTSTRYAPHNQDSQNRARQGGRLVEDVTPTHKYHRSLSQDKEIESFILTRGGSQKNNKMDDKADDDDDTQTQSSMEYPKKQQRQASASTHIKDSDQSSSSSEDEEDDDDELQELASTKNNEAMNEEEMMSGSDHNVDKKADEFIAKFREQIRLQRIASIRTTTTTTQAKTKTGPTTR
ncbi:zinc finger CCCH domain-containing protein 18-like protein, partial [Tanacetum coccineum]